MDLGEIV